MRALAFMLSMALVVGCNDNNNNDVQRRLIGSSCATSGQCGTGKFFCAVADPGGYCKADCRKDADCPTGSVCVDAGLLMLGACYLSCPNGPADCRSGEGYLCATTPDQASGPYCIAPTPDGGVDGGS